MRFGAASLNLTFGELRTDAGGLVLHTVSKRQFGEEFADIPVITRLDGSILTVGEVAEIRDGFVDEDIITRVDRAPAILVRVDATGQQSIVTMGEDIRSWLASYQAPPNVEIGIWTDRAGDAVDTISSIVGNAVVGTILVLLCLVVFFDLRVATWVTVGIPLSFLGSLIFFGMSGLTLNLGTIFAFFLMVGIVVDDAVVVGDSIAAEREGGKEALEAAVSGARAMVGPITIGAVTTMLAFIPLLFIHPPSTPDRQRVSVCGALCPDGLADRGIFHIAGPPCPIRGAGACRRCQTFSIGHTFACRRFATWS